MNFDQVDIRAVVKTIGEITGINFVLDDKVSGTVTVMSPTDIPLSEVYTVLESILEVHGFTAIPSGNVVKIIPKPDAARQNLPVRVGSDPCQIPVDDALVTQIMPLRYAHATEMGQVVQSQLTTDGKVASYGRTNADRRHRHLRQGPLHRHRDRPARRGAVQGAGQGLRPEVRLGPGPGRPDHTNPAEDPARLRAWVQAVQGRGPRTRTCGSCRTSGPTPWWPSAPAADLATVADLVSQLDVPRPAGSGDIHVVYLKNATAKEVAQSLTAAIANLRISGTVDDTRPIQVTADDGTNALIIAASSQDFETVSQIIEKLDIVREQVLVEMLILEISEEKLPELGVDWATLDDASPDGVRGFARTNLGPRVNFLNGDRRGSRSGPGRRAVRASQSGRF